MKYSAGNEFGVNYCECLFLGRDLLFRIPHTAPGLDNLSRGLQMRYHYAPPEGWMGDEKPSEGRWEQLNKCPECGEDMKRDAAVGERIGLFYRCAKHGRFRYSWDHDRLERE